MLTWDNGEGQTFDLAISVDDNYMFSVQQRVHNAGDKPVSLYPWSRIRRDYTPKVLGYYILHEGPLGVLGGTLKEQKYTAVKSDGAKNGGLSLENTGTGGWAGITDKYWLVALVPDQEVPATAAFRYVSDVGGRAATRWTS